MKGGHGPVNYKPHLKPFAAPAPIPTPLPVARGMPDALISSADSDNVLPSHRALPLPVGCRSLEASNSASYLNKAEVRNFDSSVNEVINFRALSSHMMETKDYILTQITRYTQQIAPGNHTRRLHEISSLIEEDFAKDMQFLQKAAIRCENLCYIKHKRHNTVESGNFNLTAAYEKANKEWLEIEPQLRLLTQLAYMTDPDPIGHFDINNSLTRAVPNSIKPALSLPRCGSDTQAGGAQLSSNELEQHMDQIENWFKSYSNQRGRILMQNLKITSDHQLENTTAPALDQESHPSSTIKNLKDTNAQDLEAVNITSVDTESTEKTLEASVDTMLGAEHLVHFNIRDRCAIYNRLFVKTDDATRVYAARRLDIEPHNCVSNFEVIF
jgi:hypothetical protein